MTSSGFYYLLVLLPPVSNRSELMENIQREAFRKDLTFNQRFHYTLPGNVILSGKLQARLGFRGEGGGAFLRNQSLKHKA